MKNNFKLNGGYIGLIVVLVVVLGGMYFLFKSDTKVEKNDVVNLAEDTSDSKTKIEEDKLTEENTSKIPQESTETKQEKPITNNDNKKVMQAILHTSKGDITLELNSATPKTVENFVKLAKEGFYDGTKFHRVIKGFMSQGGDPLSKDDSKMAYWGTGGPGYKFDDELVSGNKNDAYTISMANAGPNTNGSQFFINAVNNNFLDSKHVVFGHVVSGKEVADMINKVATDPSDRPTEPVVIKNITLK